MRIARIVEIRRPKSIDGIEFAIDLPRSGMGIVPLELTMTGWIRDVDKKVQEFKISYSGAKFVQVPHFRSPRPDLSDGSEGVNSFGYKLGIHLRRLGFPEQIEIFAIIAGMPNPVRFAEVIIEYVDVAGTESRTPLLVTALGRTGSSRLMDLLSKNPSIAVAGQFPYEERVASYFSDFFFSTTRFGETTQKLPRYFAQGSLPFNELVKPSNFSHMDKDGIFRFTSDLIRVAASSTKDLVDLHYTSFSGRSVREAPVFAEKLVGSFYTQELLYSIYDKVVEIILVRDFRDSFTSAMQFNRKRGYLAFGRERSETDSEWINGFAGDAKGIMQASKMRSGALVVKYEDLVLDPVAALKKVWTAIGVEDVALDELEDKGTNENHRTSASAESSIARWKQELPSNLVEPLNTALAEPLGYFGYT